MSDEGASPTAESVWDYPRPPRLEPTSKRLVVRFGGRPIASTESALRVLETSHPPAYYFPPVGVDSDALRPHPRTTWCEFKGVAHYCSVAVGERTAEAAVWTYPAPTEAFEALRGYFAFYAHLMDSCSVDGERVQAQESAFYGGWLTSDIRGPFKGPRGTRGW